MNPTRHSQLFRFKALPACLFVFLVVSGPGWSEGGGQPAELGMEAVEARRMQFFTAIADGCYELI